MSAGGNFHYIRPGVAVIRPTMDWYEVPRRVEGTAWPAVEASKLKLLHVDVLFIQQRAKNFSSFTSRGGKIVKCSSAPSPSACFLLLYGTVELSFDQ